MDEKRSGRVRCMRVREVSERVEAVWRGEDEEDMILYHSSGGRVCAMV